MKVTDSTAGNVIQVEMISSILSPKTASHLHKEKYPDDHEQSASFHLKEDAPNERAKEDHQNQRE